MALAPLVAGMHTYHGNNTQVNFSNDQNGLSVTIDTENLHMRSVQATEKDYDHYGTLFGDPEVVQKFATGEAKTREQMKKRIDDVWAKRWHENDPYSAFAVFEKSSGNFVGHAVLGHTDTPGEAELAGLGHQDYWHRGLGQEAAAAIVEDFAPATIKEGYLLDGSPLRKIVATARTDNYASKRILENIGMEYVRSREKHGARREEYAMYFGARAEPEEKKAGAQANVPQPQPRSWCVLL
jgi:[ribosomal protein S5]-alanine N-acetyltransferase